MERRSFFKLFAGAAATPVVIHNIPKAKAHEIAPGHGREAPEHRPEQCIASSTQQHLARMAVRAVHLIDTYLGEYYFRTYARPFPSRIHCDELLLPGDTINIACPMAFDPVRIFRHLEANFALPDPIKGWNDDRLLHSYMEPACHAIAEGVGDHLARATLVVYGRQSLPIPGIGALGARAKSQLANIRLLMSYSPVSLCQHFSIDTLFGIKPLTYHEVKVLQAMNSAADHAEDVRRAMHLERVLKQQRPLNFKAVNLAR